MSRPNVFRQALGKGLLLAALLYGATTVAVLALVASIVVVAEKRGEDPAGLEALLEAAQAVTLSAARLAVDPSNTAWVELGRSNTALEAAASTVIRGPAAHLPELAELKPVLDTMLAERYERVAQAIEEGALGALSSLQTSAEDRMNAKGELDAPLAMYLRALEQLVAQTDRLRGAWGGGESRTLSVLLFLALVLATLGLAGASVYLAGLWRTASADIRALASYAGKIARGEYPDGILPDRNDALGELGRSLQRLTRLEKALIDVKDISVSFQGITHGLAAQVEAAVSRSTSQTTRIDGAVKMLDDIVQAIQTVYTNARRSLETAEESGREIGTSIEKLLQGESDVRRLEELTNRIEEIVSLISSIADQTDILSLNAGIEAARAGSYGRGFTVVASEVRKLADRSGRSALEISELTQSILAVVRKIASRTDEESVVMASIQKGLGRIIEAVGQVTKVSEAARDNIESLSKAIDEITGGIADAQRDAGDLAKTVRGLRGDVERLRSLGSDIGFSISTATFAAWSAEDRTPEPGSEEPEAEETQVESPNMPDAGEPIGPGAPGSTQARSALTGAEDAAPVMPAESEPVAVAAAQSPVRPAAAPPDAEDEVLDDLEPVE